LEASVLVKLGVAAECVALLGMETSVPVQLGVAAECAELLGLEASVLVKLGVAAECARLARNGNASSRAAGFGGQVR